MMKIKIDKNKCIGCGTCTVLAPKSFKLGGDGKAQVIEPPGDDQVKIKEAIDSCPVNAIKSAD
jgi:ferredoxin